MSTDSSLRLLRAFAPVVVAAVALPALGAGVVEVAVVLVAGIAAVLLARGTEAEAPAPPPAPPPGPSLDEVLDTVVDPVLVIAGGRVTLANATARALLGGHVVGEDARVAIRHPAAAEALATATGQVIELVGIGAHDRRWEMRVAPMAEGLRVVTLHDRTEQAQAERMRVDFVANASHELRTPLASILGYAETLIDEAGDDRAIRARFLTIVMDEARRMQRLVEDLLSLSRIEADKYRAPDAAVDLAVLLGEVCAELRASGRPRAADIACEVDGAVPAVAGDRAQLSQLLHNLLGNAMKYGRAATPIVAALHRHGSGVRLVVTDQGDGIAPEHLPRLTERFYRVDAGRSRAMGGTGLGLAIVKHIVERHRGRIDIASKVGVGTGFTVTLPAAPAPPAIGVTKG
jgi:two-component system phosphate regulon sensor histidine kinase PhoR